jgi:cell division protein FtsL
MRSTMFVEDNNQFPVKTQRLSFSFFIFSIIIVSFLVIGYICSNIVLMKLGYQSIELEKKKDELMVQKYQLESTVENLSSLTRIEKIAVQELGMCRPERIEFIAMLPNNIVFDMMAQQPSIPESDNRFIEAGSLFKEFANLKIFQNQ